MIQTRFANNDVLAGKPGFHLHTWAGWVAEQIHSLAVDNVEEEAEELEKRR